MPMMKESREPIRIEELFYHEYKKEPTNNLVNFYDNQRRQFDDSKRPRSEEPPHLYGYSDNRSISVRLLTS